ncbi:unnamed protein product, partial [Adineta steineri]
MTDFETGTIKPVKDMLPNILHRGYLFHFSQAVCRQVQSKGLTTKYNEDEVINWLDGTLTGCRTRQWDLMLRVREMRPWTN